MPPFHSISATAAFTLLFALFAWYRISWRFHREPDLKRPYAYLFFGWLLWANSTSLLALLPSSDWTGTATQWYYLGRPLLLSAWILLFGGASVLEKYPGLPIAPVGRADRIRIYTMLFLALTFLPGILDLGFTDILPNRPELFPLLFASFMVAISYLLSAISGWQWLAENYRFKEKFKGKVWSMQSGTLGLVSANHCLRLGGNDEGFFLGMILPFRIGHPSLFVPWSDLLVGNRKFLFFRTVVFEFKKCPGVLLVLSHGTAERVLNLAPPSAFTK